ncbi:MAG TPA: glycosyltransferase, partial [Vicinamibacteria bacterium]|nr:glycosyltransferase [Vicinamibacteria bacterium]
MASLRRDAHESGPLRLLWLIDSLTLGGAESLVGRFAGALDPAHVHLRVAFLKSIAGNPFETELRSRGVPLAGLHARHLRDVGALRRLVRLIREERIDLVHAHLTYAAIFGAVAARLTGTPLVATLHLPPSPESAWSAPGARDRIMGALLGRFGSAVVCVSGALRDSHLRTGRVRADKLVVVHNGVDVASFERERGRREDHRHALGLAAEAKAVFTVSVLRPGKGIDVLLRAVKTVAASVPEAVFLVAGDGPLFEPLRVEAERLGLGQRVRWLGLRHDVPALLAAGDLFVLPSLHDAFPTALLEAMASGLPLVATEAGGIPEIVGAPATGVLVPPGDAE